ncbi:succinate dehydrogenase subunit 3 [Trifolium pratense]|uniref:Succinate dehydrogenase subunit 3 n=1 Tax=Trifolium pratense TaxID=57577 RepID=A0A2K3NKV7_TRIPR|nr:succinate dehydrogenase subunit 3 [Trifolium pratense]
MSWLLRSTKSKLLSSSSLSRTFSSIPRSTNQIGAISPASAELFHRTTATLSTADENPIKGNLIGFPKNLENKLGGDSNVINSLCVYMTICVFAFASFTQNCETSKYQALGLDTNVLAGVRYGTNVCATKSPMLLGVNALMARNFVRGVGADALGLAGHRRFLSDIPSKASETSSFRPLSPHLPVYQPQLSSTLSICNRIAGAFLSAVVLLFYIIYMKIGVKVQINIKPASACTFAFEAVVVPVANSDHRRGQCDLISGHSPFKFKTEPFSRSTAFN